MSPYKHLPLPLGSIRLLQLLPDRESSKLLRCKLLVCTLLRSDGRARPYEALSYVWGSEEGRMQSVFITNDQKDNQTDFQELPIRENLYAALLHLQDPELPRLLWVDAICIDQSHSKEKAEQILLMAEVYAKASRVIVWLREPYVSDSLVPEAEGSNALDAIRLAASAHSVEIQDAQKQAIAAFLGRSWFQRIWV